LELAALDERGDIRGGDVLDVRLAAHEERDDSFADVEPDDPKTCFLELDRERQTDVPEADHADDGAPVLDLRQKTILRGRLSGHKTL
jgi:hypothetical protein